MARALMATAILVALTAAAAAQEGTAVALDGLTSKTPADWKEANTGKPFRFKEFVIPKKGDDKADAELIISQFGAGQGGTVEQNLERYKGQFQIPEGKKPEDAVKVEKITIAGVEATYIDVQGTYLYKANPMAQVSEKRPNYRHLVVIYPAKEHTYFIRLLGGEKTVGENKKAFEEWLKNFK